MRLLPFMKGALDDYANIFYLPADEIDLNRVSKADAWSYVPALKLQKLLFVSQSFA